MKRIIIACLFIGIGAFLIFENVEDGIPEIFIRYFGLLFQ